MIICIIVLILVMNIYANDNKDRILLNRISSNAMYVEFGGSGLVFSANYDYRFAPNWTVRVGLSYLIFGLGLPLSINYITGEKNAHHLELGAGLTYAKVTSLFGDGTKSSFVPSLSVGYRYQPVDGGFILRILFTPLFFIEKEGKWIDESNPFRGVKYEHVLSIRPFAGVSLGFTLK
ncbi:MAG: hypothetical protein N2249_01525 [Melioribacter sp.]|nr:hypothetical protein [Melioribacter sp.]